MVLVMGLGPMMIMSVFCLFGVFFAVELKEIGVHPGFIVSEAIGDSGVGGRGDGFSGDVELNIIGIAVKIETMVANDIAKGKQVYYEEERTKHRTLGDALRQRSSGGGAVVSVDELLSVSEIRSEPGEGSAGDIEGRFKAGEKNGVVDSVKSCS